MDTTLHFLTQVKPSVSFMGVAAYETSTHDHANNQAHSLDYSNNDRVETKVVTL